MVLSVPAAISFSTAIVLLTSSNFSASNDSSSISTDVSASLTEIAVEADESLVIRATASGSVALIGS